MILPNTNKKTAASIAYMVSALGLFLLTENVRSETIDGPEPYIGGSYGYLSTESDDFEDDDDAYSVFGGIRFHRFFAAELGYTKFADVDETVFSSETQGLTLSALGYFVETDVIDVYGKLGVLRWDSSVEVVGFDEEYDGVEGFYGLGADLTLNEYLTLRAEYSRFKVEIEEDEVGVFEGQDFDLNYASVGIIFNF